MMVDKPHSADDEKPSLNPSARHWALPFILVTILFAMLAVETGQLVAWLFATLFALAALNIWTGGGRPTLSLSEFFHTERDMKPRLAPIFLSALLSTGLLLILYALVR